MNAFYIVLFLLSKLKSEFYNLKIKKEIRKLQDDNSIITIILKGEIGDEVRYLNFAPNSYVNNKPDYVYLNDQEEINYSENEFIILNKDDYNKVEIIWAHKLQFCNFMFDGCTSLISVDLTKFDASNVLYMNSMFRGCTSLLSVNLSNLNTSSLELTGFMFSGCTSLVSLDLSVFDTSKLQTIDNMFKGCSSLLSLDLSNFKIAYARNKDNLFTGCNKLKYINLKNYEGIDIFSTIPNTGNIITCMDKFDELSSNSLKTNGARNICSDICFQKIIILNVEEEKCYYNCPKLDEDKFCNYDHTQILSIMPEGYFLNDTYEKTIDRCYHICKKCFNYGDENNNNCIECIENFYPKIDNINNCYFEPEGYYLDGNIYKPCYISCKNCFGFGDENNNNCKECNSNYRYLNESLYKNNCYKNCEFYNYNKILNKYECSQQGFSILIDSSYKTKNEIFNSLDELILDKEPRESYVINGDEYSVIISPINRKIENSNIIDFSECEKILKVKYPDFEFRTLQINIKNTNPQCLIDQVEYRIYNQFGQNIDLSVCDDVNITIQYIINDESLLNIEQILYFKNKGIDIFQINDNFFNDVCYPYSDEKSNSDMILKDRVSDIYQNYSICEKGCEYDFIDVEKLYVNCNCKIKTSVSNEIKEGNFKDYISGSFLYSNFGIIECYKLVFSIKGKLTNLGFWLFGVIIISHFPIYIIYFINKINPIKNYIENEMNNNGYKVNNKKTPNTKEKNQQDTEEEKIETIPYNSKKRSKFYKKSNFPPKKIINNTFNSKNNKFN